MTVKNFRAGLAADPQLGAGNVVATVLAHGASPDGPGLTFDTEVDGRPAWQPLTLGELDERIDARAAWLHQRGIKPRDPVAVYVTNAADQILQFFALTRLGAIPALINGNLPGEIAAEYIGLLRAVGVLTDADHRQRLAGHEVAAPHLGDVAELGTGDPAAAPPPYRHHADDPISITHSSGTTGLPKPVVHTHGTLFEATRRIRLSSPKAQGTERVLCALPAAHTAGILAVNQALCNQAELVFLSSQRGEYVLDSIETWRPTGVYGFSVTWVELARLDLDKRDLSSVAIWFNTGDAAHEAHIRRLVAQGSHKAVTREGVATVPGSSFIDGLGSSEMGHAMFHITHRTDTNRYDRCVGKVHVFAEVRVLNLDGEELPVGEVGHMAIRTPTLFPGYWNDSVTTYRSRLRGYYLTGDLIYRDADDYFYHVDRAADSIELGNGVLLHTALSEERIMARCPDVVDCTVVAVSVDGGAVTDVFLLLEESAERDVDRTAAVREALGEAAAATLRQVTVVEGNELPTGATGKVRKLILRQRHATAVPAPSAAPAGAAPATTSGAS